MEYLILCKKAEYFETEKNIIELAYYPVSTHYPQ
jgi:hypothetical protein